MPRSQNTRPVVAVGAMTPGEFIAKWRACESKERSAAQSHFNDLCRLLGEPTPTDADPTGEWYCFERGARKDTGGDGWVDVWKRGCFAWEYKGRPPSGWSRSTISAARLSNGSRRARTRSGGHACRAAGSTHNAVRLQLHALACNLGNFMRTLAVPDAVEQWSLTSLREKFIKIGAKWDDRSSGPSRCAIATRRPRPRTTSRRRPGTPKCGCGASRPWRTTASRRQPCRSSGLTVG